MPRMSASSVGEPQAAADPACRTLDYGAMSSRYKRFPPGRGNLLVPLSSKAASRAAIAMYSPSRRRGFLIQQATWHAVGLLGPIAIPGRAQTIQPLPESNWLGLLATWHESFGSFDTTAIHRPPDPHREGFGVLLLRDGRAVAFVKVRRTSDAAALHREEVALGLLSEQHPQSFRVTGALAAGSIADWAYLALAPLAPQLHRPASDPPLDRILAEVGNGLRLLPRPDATPEHWTPMHGDCTPWNLRRLDSALYLLDWESAAWAPPGADEVMYRSTAVVMRLGTPAEYERVASQHPEAVNFWKVHWTSKIDNYVAHGGVPTERALAVQTLKVLGGQSGR